MDLEGFIERYGAEPGKDDLTILAPKQDDPTEQVPQPLSPVTHDPRPCIICDSLMLCASAVQRYTWSAIGNWRRGMHHAAVLAAVLHASIGHPGFACE